MKKLLLTLLMALTLGVAGAWADSYTIEFAKVSGNNDGTALSTTTAVSNVVTTTSKDYISSFSNISKASYGSKNGIKFGNSSNNGSLTVNLSEKGKVQATTVTITAVRYGTDTNETIKLTVGNKSSVFDLKDTEQTFSLVLDQPTVISTIAIETGRKNTSGKQRGYLGSITVEYSTNPIAVEPTFSPSEAEVDANGAFTVTPEDFFTGVNNLTYECDANILTIEGNNWTAKGVGTTTVKAIWESGKYAAGSKEFTFTVKDKAPAEAPVFTPASGEYEQGTKVTIAAGEGATIHFGKGTTKEAATEVYTEGFTLTEIGEVSYVAYASADGRADSELTTVTYNVVKARAPFRYEVSEYTAHMGDITLPELTNTENLAYTLSSSNPKVVAISPLNDKELWLVGTGTTTITASFAGNAKYDAVDATYALTVENEVPVSVEGTVTFDFTKLDSDGKCYGMTPQSGKDGVYNETDENGNKFRFDNGVDHNIWISTSENSATRYWNKNGEYTLRLYSKKTITINVVEGGTITSAKLGTVNFTISSDKKTATFTNGTSTKDIKN